MNRLIFTVAACLLASACATSPVTSTAGSEPETAATAAQSFMRPAAAPDCVRYTGSRIVREDRCASGPGRVFTREEIERTGAFDLGEALQLLDPSIR